jgi:beta-N-acetylhexosaminidase
MTRAFITGLEGATLTTDERRLVREFQPAGLILFARNCRSPDQIRALVAEFKSAAGHDRVLVLIDQEGGRVQRIRPPHASLLPAAAAYLAFTGGDVLAAARRVRLGARLAAAEMRDLGIDTVCAPVLDVPVEGAHDIIGNRAYAHDPATVAALGGAAADGLMAGGVLPVIKHIPGHGRARADSHLELPVVDASREALAASDLEPFRLLAHLPAAMTAHVVYTALDAERPATTSAKVIRDVIRGDIGFGGLLMSDDLGMKALVGSFALRTREALAGGCDLALHCSGNLEEMEEVASASPELQGAALGRFERALRIARTEPASFDRDAAREALAPLVARVA